MKHPIDCTHYLTLTVAMFSATLGFCLFLSAHSLVILWILWAIQNPPNKFPSSLSYACIYEPLKSIWNILLFFFLSAENNVTFSAPSIIHFHTWIFIKITWWISLTHRLLGPTPMVSDTEWSWFCKGSENLHFNKFMVVVVVVLLLLLLGPHFWNHNSNNYYSWCSL